VIVSLLSMYTFSYQPTVWLSNQTGSLCTFLIRKAPNNETGFEIDPR
jgi:hypothetical protein